jgi:hypothetical protein
MVTSKTVGGTVLHDESDRITREQSLRLCTHGSAWFSHDDAIRGLESVLTIVGGKIDHSVQEFASLAPPLPGVSPDWSPVARFGGYDNARATPPAREHTPIMSVDGRVWDAGCGCGN